VKREKRRKKKPVLIACIVRFPEIQRKTVGCAFARKQRKKNGTKNNTGLLEKYARNLRTWRHEGQ
jgi:hypothetical protein